MEIHQWRRTEHEHEHNNNQSAIQPNNQNQTNQNAKPTEPTALQNIKSKRFVYIFQKGSFMILMFILFCGVCFYYYIEVYSYILYARTYWNSSVGFNALHLCIHHCFVVMSALQSLRWIRNNILR